MTTTPAPHFPPPPSDPRPRSPIRGLRWYICGLLFLVTAINYIDRVTVGAMWDDTLAPALRARDGDYAWLQFWFNLAYGVGFAFAGRLIDRYGVRRGLALGAVVWSLAALGHAFASTLVGFAIARFVLGLGESSNFPAAIKAVAEWFPRRERSFAAGVFNTGSNVGAMLIGVIGLMAVHWGWRTVFVTFGALGFAWLALWLAFYRSREEHPRLSREEAEWIRADDEPSVVPRSVPWPCLLRYRETWAFCLGKMLTDPVWWFYLLWAVPIYLKRYQHLDLKAAALSMAVIYLCADLGSLLGGWLPGRLQRAGWAPSRARRTTMLMFASLMPVSLLLNGVESAAAAVAILSLATACHQGWSANMFTVASDTFPPHAVGSIVGFGAMCGGIGGMFMPLIAGAVLTLQGHFGLLFVVCGVLHPLSWIVIRALTGRELQRVPLDRGLRTAFSPRLLTAGAVLVGGGAAGAIAAWRSWPGLVSVLQNDRAAAAGVFAVAMLLAVIGAGLAFASREQAVRA